MNTYTLNRQRLINCRKQLGITKQEAAKRMLMSQPAYLRYESGERKPSIHVIQFMAYVLGTSTNYLIGETDNPKPDSYWVKMENEPELFDIVTTYVNSDANTQNRLLSYFQMWIESTAGNNIL